MATTISGVRIDKIGVEDDDKELKCSGQYSLISDKGFVLATQGFNGYNDIKIEVPAEATRNLLKEVEKAVKQTLGMEDE